jgi:hypothetical protein
MLVGKDKFQKNILWSYNLFIWLYISYIFIHSKFVSLNLMLR